jgi:hypothetical protein
MERIVKERLRNHAFQYLTVNAGRGPKNSLKRLIIEIEQTKISYLDREIIESKIIGFNEKHYQKVQQIIVF